ncbi:MAG: LCP family protein [Firmicutes bacterium]|nr:LCP family protein [Bacillota bacterium]
MRLGMVLKNVLIGLLCFSVAFFSGASLVDWYARGHNLPWSGTDEQQRDDQPGRINILLLGMDARPGEDKARTDTIILASIDRDTKKVALVSIPRDSRVQIPGHGWDKINAAYLIGGPAMTQKIVGDLLGIPVPYYMVTNFQGFQGIVDTLGGVEINVEKRMYYPDEGIDLKPGLQRLNGKDALGYVRYRYDPLGDITRTERQQKFLTALAKEAVQMKTVTKLPKLIPQLKENVNTNLGFSDMLFLAQVAASIDPSNIATQTLPGDFLNIDGASYWEPDRVKAKTVVAELFNRAGIVQHITITPSGVSGGTSSGVSSGASSKTSSGVSSKTSNGTSSGASSSSGARSGTSSSSGASNGTSGSTSGGTSGGVSGKASTEASSKTSGGTSSSGVSGGASNEVSGKTSSGTSNGASSGISNGTSAPATSNPPSSPSTKEAPATTTETTNKAQTSAPST